MIKKLHEMNEDFNPSLKSHEKGASMIASAIQKAHQEMSLDEIQEIVELFSNYLRLGDKGLRYIQEYIVGRKRNLQNPIDESETDLATYEEELDDLQYSIRNLGARLFQRLITSVNLEYGKEISNHLLALQSYSSEYIIKLVKSGSENALKFYLAWSNPLSNLKSHIEEFINTH